MKKNDSSLDWKGIDKAADKFCRQLSSFTGHSDFGKLSNRDIWLFFKTKYSEYDTKNAF